MRPVEGAPPPRRQDRYWPSNGAGGDLRLERHFDDRTMRCFSDRPRSIDAMFVATVERHGEHEALVWGEERLSYRELDERVERFAANLARRSIGAGDRVVLLIGNRPEFLVAALACARIGAVTVPVGPRQARLEVAHVLNDCGARGFVFEAALAANVPERAQAPGVVLRACVGGAADDAEPAEALLEPCGPAPRAPVDEDDVAALLYTSGTTGKPKGAMLTHLGIVHTAIHYQRCFSLTPADRTMLAVPASHVTGLVALLLTTVHVGGCNVLLPEFKAPAFIRLAERERMTYTLLVPAMYVLCLRDESLAAADLTRWRIGAFGGSPMPDWALEAMAERLPGLALCQAYGATETTSPATLVPPGTPRRLVNSVGQAVPCGEIRVVDEHGAEVPPGQPGEVLIAGPMVVKGYWNNPVANGKGFVDGFWRSGDMGSMDEDGWLHVFDRIKDMINRGGFKVYSAEVENVLSQHPDVLECAVVAVPCPVLGERVKAVVVPKGRDASAEALRGWCAQHLADYKVPEFVDFRSEPLPRNANGKVQKNPLRQVPTGTAGERPHGGTT